MKNYSSRKVLRAFSVVGLMLMMQGCASTIVGAVVDTAIEVVKVPFKVGGAIIDAASSGKEEDKKTRQEQK
ncbi:MAG: NF038104 family lipoprotein [Burkholderiales bacterium]